MLKGMILRQRVAISFTAGVVGGLAVVLFSHLLYSAGISNMLGVKEPASLSAPEIYRPLVWGGIWGIPFGLVLKSVWDRLYLFGFIYFIAPVIALYFVFMPMKGLGYFGLEAGLGFSVYLLVVNIPYGIVTAIVARILIGKNP